MLRKDTIEHRLSLLFGFSSRQPQLTDDFDIPEDDDGLTLGSDTRITSEIGGGPGQCTPPPGAPDLLGSFHVDEPFPAFGPTTPGGDPYDLGICISTSAFNQLLKAQIECGLLQLDLTEFDLGFGPVPLTTGVLAVIIPELSVFPPDSPLTIALRPTLAPLLTGAPGPSCLCQYGPRAQWADPVTGSSLIPKSGAK